MCLCEEADMGQEELQPDDLPDFSPPLKCLFLRICVRVRNSLEMLDVSLFVKCFLLLWTESERVSCICKKNIPESGLVDCAVTA